MSPDDPRHGTNRGATAHYSDGETPCDACRRAKSRYAKRATLDKVQGKSREVELGEVAHAIMQRAPLGYLSTVSGLSSEHLAAIRRGGPGQRVFRTTRAKILAAGRIAYWSNVGIRRRCQALMALGWNARAIAGTCDASEGSILRVARGEPDAAIRAELSLKVLVAYEALSMRLPPEQTPHERGSASKTRQFARRHRFLPPLAWNDIDDPSERPVSMRGVPDMDPVVVDRILAGEVALMAGANRLEREAVIARWPETGRSLAELSRATGIKPERYRKDGAA